jgi:hypothetical protein
MKRIVLREFDLLSENLSNQNAVFSYRLKNLCVKAEEVALLPIEVVIEGEPQKLEQCTVIGKKDDYSFMIFPKYDEDLIAVGHGIMLVHPEFKQKVESMKVDSVDKDGNPKEVDAHYILTTMPEVDDDRYDVLKDGVKACYEECKAKMEAANLKADAKMAQITVGESEEDLEKLKDARQQLNDEWYGQRDKIYEAKLQEIEDAHNKWLSERAESEQERLEKEAAHDEHVATSMRLDAEVEE